MPISRRRYIVAALALLALAIVGALVWYFFIRTETVAFNSYVCEDGSYYFVVEDTEAIEVAGRRYELVSETDGKRYEGTDPMAYTIRGSQIEVSLKESGQVLATCATGQIENAPIVDEIGS